MVTLIILFSSIIILILSVTFSRKSTLALAPLSFNFRVVVFFFVPKPVFYANPNGVSRRQ